MKQQNGMLNAFDPGSAKLDQRTAALVDRRAAALGPAYRLFYETPLHIVRGKGARLFDADGRSYLDAYNNVAGVGHCHPHVVEAMARQAAILATHTRYLHEAPLAYAERLLATLPPELDHFMFTCTGSEANDLAVRIARAATGRQGVIVTENAYHGVTLATSGFSPALGLGAELAPWVRRVPAPVPGDGGGAFLDAVEAATQDLDKAGCGVSMMIVDSIFSTDGVLPDPGGGLLRQAADIVRNAGGMFVADEVQSGFCRTGDSFWGFQRHGVVPDMVSMGKGMGNGYPVAGLAVSRDPAAAFGNKVRYFNTFGGNPVAASVAGAVLEVLEQESLQDNARTVGRAFRDALSALSRRHDAVGEVRSAGLFLGVDIAVGPAQSKTAHWIVNSMRDRGVLLSTAGADGATLKIRPPLVFSMADVADFVAALEQTLLS